MNASWGSVGCIARRLAARMARIRPRRARLAAQLVAPLRNPTAMAANGAATSLQDKHSFLHQTRFPGDLVLAAGPKVYAPGPPTNAHEALTNATTGFFAERLPAARRGWPRKDAAPLRGHLVGVSLEGAVLSKDMAGKRTAAVLRVADVTSPHDGPELVLYVRLQRPVAAEHGLKACTPEDVPHFRLNNAEARRLLCNLWQTEERPAWLDQSTKQRRIEQVQ